MARVCGENRKEDKKSAEHDFAIAFDNAAYAVKLFSSAFQKSLCFLELLGGNYDQHPQAHVESAEHFFFSDIAERLEMFEDRQDRPRAELDHGGSAFGQHTREVLGNAAAGNVCQGGHAFASNQLANDRPIAAVGAHELVADFVLDLADESFRRILGDFKKQFARERVTISVQAV